MQGTFKRSRCSQCHAHLGWSLLLARLLPAPATPRPRLTRCRPCAVAPLPWLTHPAPVEASDSLVPPPNTDTRPHARPDAHLPCAQMYRVGTDADAHEQAAQVGKAHKSAAKRGGRRGEGHRSIKVRRGSCPRIRLSPLLGSKRSRRRSRIDLSRMLRRQTRTLCTRRPCCTMRGGGCVGGAAGGWGNRGRGHVQR